MSPLSSSKSFPPFKGQYYLASYSRCNCKHAWMGARAERTAWLPRESSERNRAEEVAAEVVGGRLFLSLSFFFFDSVTFKSFDFVSLNCLWFDFSVV